MATTQHTFRLFLLIRAAQQASFNTWFAANIDTLGGDRTFTASLSPTGIAPATHYFCAISLTAQQMGLVIRRLATLAGIPLPDWSAMTREERVDWLQASLPTIQTILSIRVRWDVSTAGWDGPNGELIPAGLRRILPAGQRARRST